MPDEIEVPLDDAQDRVIELHKERHHVGEAHHEAAGDAQTSWTRYVGVATALLAVIAAIGALQAGRLVNESLLQKNEQVGKLTAASDKWNEYQAQGLKSIIYSTAAQGLPPNSPDIKKDLEQSKHYAEKKTGLMEDAKKLEEEAKASSESAEHFLKRHELFALSVSLCQIAIALSAVAALTKRRRIWLFGISAGLVGFALMLYGFLKV